MNNLKVDDKKKNNTNKSLNDKSKGWPFIIFVNIIFWPAGLYFFNKKFHEEKLSINVTSNIKKVAVGLVALAIFGVANPEVQGKSQQSFAGPFIFLILGAIVLFIYSKKLKEYSIKYQKYNSIINKECITSLDNIATTVQTPYEVVVKDLQDMISRGYFEDAYIDDAKREVKLLSKENSENIEYDKKKQEKIIVTCSGCGASNTILKGTSGECEYCGTIIKA